MNLRYVVSFIVFAVGVLLLQTTLLGAYSNKDFILGLLAEAHGVIIEFLLVAVLFTWLLKRRDEQKLKPLINILYANVFLIGNGAIKKFSSDGASNECMVWGFGEHWVEGLVITHHTNSYTNSYKDILDLHLAAELDQIDEILETKRKELDELLQKITVIKESCISIFPPDISSQLIAYELICTEYKNDIVTMLKGEPGIEALKSLNDIYFVVAFHAVKLRTLLEGQSQKTITKAEYMKRLVNN